MKDKNLREYLFGHFHKIENEGSHSSQFTFLDRKIESADGILKHILDEIDRLKSNKK